MEILVIGDENNLLECQLKFGGSHHYQIAKTYSEAATLLKSVAVVFDFQTNKRSSQIQVYRNFKGIVFLECSKITLKMALEENETNAIFFGFCGLPTFLNREILEVSIANNIDEEKLAEICRKLSTQFAVVKD